jgi:hypothetical protein
LVFLGKVKKTCGFQSDYAIFKCKAHLEPSVISKEVTLKLPVSLLVFIMFAQCSCYVNADTLFLNDGTSISGKVIRVDDKGVAINAATGEVVVDGAEILRVEWTLAEVSQAENKNQISTPLDFQLDKSFKSTADAPSNTIFKKDQIGLGVGLLLGRTGLGLYSSFDYNLSNQSQFHVQFEEDIVLPFGDPYSIKDSTYDRITKFAYVRSRNFSERISTTYRYFPFAETGFFLGAGIGLSKSTLTFDSVNTYDKTTKIDNTYEFGYSSKFNGTYLIGELGWLISDRAYVRLSYQAGTYIYTKDNFDIDQVPNAPLFRDEIIKQHNAQKLLGGGAIGAGIYF